MAARETDVCYVQCLAIPETDLPIHLDSFPTVFLTLNLEISTRFKEFTYLSKYQKW